MVVLETESTVKGAPAASFTFVYTRGHCRNPSPVYDDCSFVYAQISPEMFGLRGGEWCGRKSYLSRRERKVRFMIVRRERRVRLMIVRRERRVIYLPL